jgi:SPP1 gp7 family putative phage head morphogenesis protein
MTTDISKQLLDYSLHHAVNLGRYSNSVVRDILALLNDADKEILAKILKRGEDGTFTKARLDKLLVEIRAVTKETYAQAHNEMTTAMLDFSVHEAAATATLLSTQVAVNFNIVQPTVEQLAAIASKTPIRQSRTGALLLEEVFQKEVFGHEQRIMSSLRLGMVQGKTIDEMVRDLKGTKASQWKDGVLEISRRSAEGIVRTVTNHVGNRAAQLTYQANSEVVKGWIYVATLDGKVCHECWPDSGKRFDIGRGPLPPKHTRCRCFSVPEVKTWKELGFDFDEMSASFRSSKDGPVKADIKFGDWLKTQGTETQKDILGATRQKLFSEGMNVDRFADRAGVVCDLKELKSRNEAAFKKVFG